MGRPSWWWVGAAVAVLAAANVANNVAFRDAYPWLSVAEVVALLALARGAGLTAADLGLARGTWRRGAAWGGALAAAVTLVYVVVLLVDRDAFLDRRADLDPVRALWAALVTVPVGTVVLEEVGFRGVLWGLVARLRGPAAATVVSAVLFGLWHVVPSLGLGSANRAVGEVLGGRTAAVVLLGVVFTTVAGIVLAELRRRSGSLLAPVLLHWTTNGLGYLFGALVWATTR